MSDKKKSENEEAADDLERVLQEKIFNDSLKKLQQEKMRVEPMDNNDYFKVLPQEKMRVEAVDDDPFKDLPQEKMNVESMDDDPFKELPQEKMRVEPMDEDELTMLKARNEKAADDLERVLQGKMPKEPMHEDELIMLQTTREYLLWENAAQATKHISEDQIDQDWKRLQARMNAEEKEGSIAIEYLLWENAAQATKHISEDQIDQDWKRLQARMNAEEKEGSIAMTSKQTDNITPQITARHITFKQWLPIAASLAAISLSLYVWINAQSPVSVSEDNTLVAKGYGGEDRNESTDMMNYTLIRSKLEALSMLESLSQHFEVRDVVGLKSLLATKGTQHLESNDNVLSFMISFSSKRFTSEQKRLLDQYDLPVTSNDTHSAIKITIKIKSINF